MILIGETANCLLFHSVLRCVLKIANFRYHGNRGWCDTNFVCTVKFADPEKRMFCARIGDISRLQAKL